MNNSNIILVTRPMKSGDPTEYTYKWGEQAVKMMKEHGFTVIDIKTKDVTYDNVSKSIQYYNPRLYVHIGHGCPTSLQGQNECVITRRFTVDELLSMKNFREIIKPLTYSSGCIHTCKTAPDICNPICTSDTNVQLLRGAIIYTVACYSAAQLGICAVKYGADTYVGYSDLMLFPVDDMNSQEIFQNVHLTFLKSLLEGHTVAEAEQEMARYEDTLIRFHKQTKYIALPLLWNKINRKVIGNSKARIYLQ